MIDDLIYFRFLVTSMVDLKSSNHKLKVINSGISKAALKAPYGNYEFLVISFGLANALSAFMDSINVLFKIIQTYLASLILLISSVILE